MKRCSVQLCEPESPRTRAAGIPLVLVDPQFTFKSPDPERYERFVKMVDDIGTADRVPVLSRYTMMKQFAARSASTIATLLSHDGLHMNDLGYRCLAHALADAIEGGGRSEALGRFSPGIIHIELDSFEGGDAARAWRHGTVSAVGFGCMSFGGFYGPTSEADSMRALARSLELGVDFWDTANVYGDGLCEQVIGKFLAEDKSRRRSRDALRPSSRFVDATTGSRFFDNSAAHIRKAPRCLAKRLGVDHIDLYYVHRVDRSIPIEDTVGELARLVKAGENRRDRPLRSRAGHAEARLRRASDRRCAIGIFAVDAQSRAWPRSGVRGFGGNSGRFLPACTRPI